MSTPKKWNEILREGDENAGQRWDVAIGRDDLRALVDAALAGEAMQEALEQVQLSGTALLFFGGGAWNSINTASAENGEAFLDTVRAWLQNRAAVIRARGGK